MTGFVLIVDDEPAIRAALAQTLELVGVEAMGTETAADALSQMARTKALPGAIFTDLRMPGMDGFGFLEKVREIDADIPVIMLTGHGDVPLAVRAMNAGAYDFLEKPAPAARLAEVAERALEKRRLVLENRDLKRRVADLDALRLTARASRMIVGDAPASRAYRKEIEAIAAGESDVLVIGETGVGKESAARAIHSLSSRRDRPFVAVNCGAMAGEEGAAELFGHQTGAYGKTGPGRPGRFEQAEGGVLFLDELEAAPEPVQVQLLRALEEREVRRIGAAAPVRVDLRIVAAIKADLADAVAAGRLRADLAYRLDVSRVRVPPLRERIADAPLLFEAFVAEAAVEIGAPPPASTPEVYARIAEYDWPGNVRELRNAAQRFAEGRGLGVDGAKEDASQPSASTLAEMTDAFERRMIVRALDAASGRVAAAATALGLPRKTLYDKIARHGIETGRRRN